MWYRLANSRKQFKITTTNNLRSPPPKKNLTGNSMQNNKKYRNANIANNSITIHEHNGRKTVLGRSIFREQNNSYSHWWHCMDGENTHKPPRTPWEWSDFTVIKHMKIEFIVPVVDKFRDSKAFYISSRWLLMFSVFKIIVDARHIAHQNIFN